MRYDPIEHGARCDICPLAGNRVVPPEPPRDGGKPRLIVVGEGPGRMEERVFRPFVGPSGALLDTSLREAGIRRSECHVTNAALCRGELDKDNDAAAVCCAPRMLKELGELPGDVPILALGKAAARGTLGVNSILLSRGFVWTTRDLTGPLKTAEAALRKAEKNRRTMDEMKFEMVRLKRDTLELRHALAGRTVFPSVHPAFVLRSDTWRPILTVDVNRLGKWLREEITAADFADKGPYVVVRRRNEILRETAKLAKTVACDIETTVTGSPLTAKTLCVGLSDGKNTVVIGPWGCEHVDRDQCTRMCDQGLALHAQLLTKILAKRVTVMHNGFNFDQIRLKLDGVEFLGALEDTLLAHHAIASHLPQRLDHVVSVFVPVSTPWKVKFGRRGSVEK